MRLNEIQFNALRSVRNLSQFETRIRMDLGDVWNDVWNMELCGGIPGHISTDSTA
jgi:hypothetical protein